MVQLLVPAFHAPLAQLAEHRTHIRLAVGIRRSERSKPPGCFVLQTHAISNLMAWVCNKVL